jgi:hypothetical protein
MNAEMLRQLLAIVEGLNGHINAVRWMREKADVEYHHQGADEVEISIHHGDDEVSYYTWDLTHGDCWIDTV